jgi:hypothetical protein
MEMAVPGRLPEVTVETEPEATDQYVFG